MKDLKELLSLCETHVKYRGELFPPIASVEYDSRKVIEGSLFVAVKGYSVDGHDYIDAAVNNGAAVLIVSEEKLNEIAERYPNVAVASSANTRQALAVISAAFFDFPSKKMSVIGITGTNGKTSITYIIEAILKTLDKKTGVIGTINYRWKDIVIPAPNTTPESRDLQEILAQMRDSGVEYCIMEVSSHGLALDRVYGIDFSGAIFTNLTQDHLDFHDTMEDYYIAKKILFDYLIKQNNQNAPAIINVDDNWGMILSEELRDEGVNPVTLGFYELGQYVIEESSIKNEITGLSYGLKSHEIDFNLHLPGLFQMYNSLCAVAMVHQLGFDLKEIKKGLEQIKNIPGRFEVMSSSLGFGVVVDYAHTGDALAKVIESAAGLSHERIITVFGCGGDRDKGKRPIMGKIAQDNSDIVIVTSDNPRTEDPQKIIDDILEGMTEGSYEVEADREKAIAMAVTMAKKNDIIVLAGKGHEDYQILGTEKIHFDDNEIAAFYIKEKENIEG
jgi:UDP-N-acetylmuramoyl-L-alanyl-D-glutamate--2,6-diaminopimelate ligase